VRRRSLAPAEWHVWTQCDNGRPSSWGLLAAEMMARTGKDPGDIYGATDRAVRRAGLPERIDAPRHPEQKGRPCSASRPSRMRRRPASWREIRLSHAHGRARTEALRWEG